MAEEEKNDAAETEEPTADEAADTAEQPADDASAETPDQATDTQAQADTQADTATAVADEDETEVQAVDLPDANETAVPATGGQIDILLDTTMPIEIRLGDVELEVRELLKLAPGSIITLEKRVGEPLDLYIKGIKFATGELVVAGDQLGVRIQEILTPNKKEVPRE